MQAADGNLIRRFGPVLGCLAIAACAATPTPERALGPGEQWLPVVSWRVGLFGDETLCAGGGFVGDVHLHGSLDDPRLAWMIRYGKREELVWPVGYSARFTPALEVLDENGQVIATEGSFVPAGCPAANGVYPEFHHPTPPPQK